MASQAVASRGPVHVRPGIVWVRTLAACALGLAVTALTVAMPVIPLAYRSPAAHWVVETMDGCVAALVACLLYGRFARQRRLQDLLLLQGMVLLAAGGLALRVLVSAAMDGRAAEALAVWLSIIVRVVAVVLVAVAATTPARRLRWRGWHVWGFVASGSFVAVVCLVLWAAQSRLPAVVDPGSLPRASLSTFATNPLLTIVETVGLVCCLVAAAAFASQGIQRSDPLLGWVGPACALGAFALVLYMAWPSVHIHWVYSADLLKLCAHLLLLWGAAQEIRQHWSRQTEAAVLRDRRRVARELHDGVVQELGYIRLELAAMPRVEGDRTVDRVLTASARAMHEARAAIDALVAAEDEPLADTLSRSLEPLAEGLGLELVLTLDTDVKGSSDERHAVVRIAREALTNAARHAAATKVTVDLLEVDGRHRLVIADDGQGFDVAARQRLGQGHGLTSMRERAQALGGELRVDSSQDTGTSVIVEW